MHLFRLSGSGLVPVARTRLGSEDQLQQWIANDPKLIGLDVLVLGREVVTEHGGRIDILAIDRDGSLVIIESKRDRTPRDILGQVLDYASWVHGLTTRQIYDLTLSKRNSSLDTLFSARFGGPPPETLNESHSVVIVAGELDASTRRIVEYLADVHGVAINTVFFSVFEHDGQTLVGTDWLLDQEEVTHRAEGRTKVPWTGLWYANVGHGETRSWDDMVRYGFLAAGGGRFYSNRLRQLSIGSRVCAYQKGTGYVGYGVVAQASAPVREFFVGEKRLLDCPLQQPALAHDADDPDLCEYLVQVEWRKTFPLAHAKLASGLFANQNVVCKLRDPATIEFLRGVFPLNETIGAAPDATGP